MDAFSAIKFFGALFAIMNPITNLPVFLAVTDGMSDAERRGVAIKTALYCLITGSVVAAAGQPLLTLFGISVDDFRVAGGLVVLLIGLGMLNGHDSSAHHGTAAEKEARPDTAAVAFYPLTFPILIGPGTIAALILYRQDATTVTDLTLYTAVFVGLVALMCVVFLMAGRFGSYISHTGRVIMTRLMGMILAAIAIEMIASGLTTLLPGLGS